MKLCEVAIFTDDVDGLADFYQKLLNASPVHRGKGIAILPAGDKATILIHEKYVPGPDDLPCENHIAFSVTNLDQSVQELISRGLKIDFPPREYPWGRSAYLRDPEGRLWELQEHASSSRSGFPA